MKNTSRLFSLFLCLALLSCSEDEEPLRVKLVTTEALYDNGCLDQSDLITWEFNWNDVPGASKYELYVIHKNATAPLIDTELFASIHIEENYAYVSEDNLLNWTFRVRAFVNNSWTEWSEASFDVEPPNTDC